ncbi:hypothetical protein ACFL6U_26785 [Planctomycetota bacterium]
MINELLQQTIRDSGVSRYRISSKTNVDKGTLCRIMQGKRCTTETADEIFQYLGFEVVIRPKRKAGK